MDHSELEFKGGRSAASSSTAAWREWCLARCTFGAVYGWCREREREKARGRETGKFVNLEKGN